MKRIITLCLAATAISGIPATASARRVDLEGRQPVRVGGREVSIKAFRNGANEIPACSDEQGMSSFSAISPATSTARMKATPTGDNLYGFLIYYDRNITGAPDVPVGLYEFENNTYSLRWMDPETVNVNELMTFTGGWLQDGKVKGYSILQLFGQIFAYEFIEYDLETGETGNIIEVPDSEMDNIQSLYFISAFDSAANTIYGYGQIAGTNDLVFMRSNPSSPLTAVKIKECKDDTEKCVSMTYNPYTKKLVGINERGQFVEINTQTGAQTVIFDVTSTAGKLSPSNTGIVYNGKTGTYYWNCRTADNSSKMAIVDADAKSVSVYADLSFREQFVGLYTTDRAIVPLRPVTPIVKSVNFTDGNTTGSIVYTLPSKLEGGDAITGKLSYTAYLDGAVSKRGEADPGTDLTIGYSQLKMGSHRFGLEVKYGQETSDLAAVRRYIGYDTPAMPQNVKLTENGLTWDAVTSGVHNGYLDLSKLRYEVFLNGVSKGTTTETSMKLDLGGDNPLSPYQARVTASCNGFTSDEATSNAIIAGKPYDLPAAWAPTEEEAKVCVAYNTQSDNTWKFKKGTGSDGSFTCPGSIYTENKSDSWIFLPVFFVKNASDYYNFSFESRLNKAGDKEVLEAIVCTEPDPKTAVCTVIEEFNPTIDYVKREGTFKVNQSGNYYVAVRCLTKGNTYGCEIRNFRIEGNNVTPESPARVANMTVTPGENGALEAVVVFNLPDSKLNGEKYAAGKKLKAVVKGSTEVTEEGEAGDRIFVTVPTAQGNNSIVVYAKDGDLNGASQSIEVYTGVDIPDVATGLKKAEYADMSGYQLSWQAPAKGANGGYIDPSKLTYDVLLKENAPYDENWQTVATGITGTQYGWKDNVGVQRIVTLAIRTVNEAGSLDTGPTTMGITGKPYQLPMLETFDQSGTSIGPWRMTAPSNLYTQASGTIETYSSVNPQGSSTDKGFVLRAPAGKKGRFMLPRFTTEKENAVAVVVTYNDNANMPEMNVIARRSSATETSMGTIKGTGSNKLMEKTFMIPKNLLGQLWTEVAFDGSFSAANQYFFMSNVLVTNNMSGVGELEAAQRAVKAIEGGILFEGFAGEQAIVADTEGRVVFSGAIVGMDTTLVLNPGIYTVKAGNVNAKLIVK